MNVLSTCLSYWKETLESPLAVGDVMTGKSPDGDYDELASGSTDLGEGPDCRGGVRVRADPGLRNLRPLFFGGTVYAQISSES